MSLQSTAEPLFRDTVMIAQNVTLSNKQEGKIQKWTKILILVSANRPFRNWLQLAPVPERPISANPICNLYLTSYTLVRVTFCDIITEFRSTDTTIFCKLK